MRREYFHSHFLVSAMTSSRKLLTLDLYFDCFMAILAIIKKCFWQIYTFQQQKCFMENTVKGIWTSIFKTRCRVKMDMCISMIFFALFLQIFEVLRHFIFIFFPGYTQFIVKCCIGPRRVLWISSDSWDD